MVKLISFLLAACLAVSSCSTTDQGTGPLQVDFGDELAQEYRDILFGASSLELIALDPDWPTKESVLDPTTLHGYGVRGRATISDRALRLDLLTALGDGARENNGMVAACFNPRHAIVAELEGQTCELIICFECLTFQVWDGTERVETVDLSETPAKRFNEIYTAEGLSIAPSY